MKSMKFFKKPAALLLAAVVMVSTALGSVGTSGTKTAEAAPGTALAASDYLTAQGKNLYTADGELVQLKGTNLGGWLFQEFWMTSSAYTDNVTAETDVYRVLEERFGEEKMWELINVYQDAYLTTADLDKMVEMGVNCIRAPFWWRNLVDENGTPYADCFERMDWIVEQAGARGMYVIIDFHGAPGSQNGSDHSGLDGKDDKQGASEFFWGENAAANQELFYEIWEMVAEHYNGNPIVAGYDLLNEPYCTYRYNTQYSDAELHELLWDIYDIAYDRIRAIDPDHIVIMEATWDPVDLPNPDVYGWTNVMYEYHNYLYDDYDNANGQQIANMQSKINSIAMAEYDVPSYMGEFAFFNNIDAWDQGLELMTKSGISYTTWTYKTTATNGNWGLVHQTNGQINLETDSYETILAKYQDVGTSSDNTALQEVASEWFKYDPVENTLGPKTASIADGEYYVKGVNSNKVVSVADDGLIQGGSTVYAGNTEQKMTITNTADGYVIFRAGNGKYVTVDADGILYAAADSADAAEKFSAVEISTGVIAFRSKTTNRFACMDENFADYRVVADRESAGSWETFTLNDPTVIVTETYSGWTRMEAEAAEIFGGAVEGQDFYSAKQGVGSMNTGVAEGEIASDLSNIKYVAFKVNAPKAGTYRALVGYNGDDDKQIVVKINDAPLAVVNVPAVRDDHAWNEMHELYLELELAEGENTVIISGTINNISTWMNLDYMDIANYPITLTDEGEIYESETFKSNGTVEAQDFYSNGNGYGGMNSNCAYANLADDFSNAKYVDYTVYVEEAGTYDISWAFNGESYDDMPAAYKVNGGEKKALSLDNAASGAWNVMNSVTFTADLNAGINTILVSGTLESYSNWANADYILVAPHVNVETVRYEAENAAIFNGINVTTDNAGNCSEGAAIGSTENQIGAADIDAEWSNVKYAEFTVEAPKKGTFGLEIAYYGDDDKTVAYQVNGGDIVELAVPNVQEDHAWNAIHTVVANIDLNAGTNTIRLTGILNGIGWINYDYIEIGEPFEIEEEEPEATHTRYESELADLHNVQIATDNAGKCSNGKAVGSTENSINFADINEDWSNVKYVDHTVTVEADGIYEVIIAYYGDDDKVVAYKINDGENAELSLPRLAGGTWDTIHKVPVMMELKAGENHIKTSGTLNGGWINYDYLDVSLAYEEIPAEEVDTTALSAAVAAAEAIDTTLYTEESVLVFTESLDAARAVLADETADQETVDAATAALNTAITNLVIAEEPETPEEPAAADKAALESAIASAEAVEAEEYTEDSIAALTAALDAAKAVAADEEATQEEVDAAAADLLAAIENLVTALEPDEGGETGDMNVMFYLLLMTAGFAGMAMSFKKKLAR